MTNKERASTIYFHPFAQRTTAITCELCDMPREHRAHDVGKFSDGYHTVDELYEHRFALWKALCRTMANHHHRSDDVVWRSRIHSDGTRYEGWFLLGLFYEAGQMMTYHLPESHWESCDFAKELDRAPLFDGHTSDDVLKRLDAL